MSKGPGTFEIKHGEDVIVEFISDYTGWMVEKQTNKALRVSHEIDINSRYDNVNENYLDGSITEKTAEEGVSYLVPLKDTITNIAPTVTDVNTEVQVTFESDGGWLYE